MVAKRPPEQGGYSLQAYIISNSQHIGVQLKQVVTLGYPERGSAQTV